MQRSSTLYGILGLVLLIFALIDYFAAGGLALIFYVNLIAGAFALVIWATSSRGTIVSAMGERRTRHGANAAIYSLAFIGILVAVNYLSTLHHRRFDLTQEKIYSLSSKTQQILKGLKKPLKFYGFFPGGSSPQARSLYEEYAAASPLVSYQFVDPDKHPELAEKYKVTVMNTTHIQYGGEKGQGTNVTDVTEQALTSAIARATRSSTKVAYFLVGHGEPNTQDAQGPGGFGVLRKSMEGEGFQVRTLLLASQPAVPKDCNLLIIAGPKKLLVPHEIDAIDAYLKQGGRAIVMLRPQPPDGSVNEDALAKMLAGWGVTVGDNVVVDQVLRLFAGPALGLNPLVDTYGAHPITQSFLHRTVFPMTRTVAPEPNLKRGLTVTKLALTSSTSWAETDLVSLFEHQRASLGPGDQKGPVAVAVAVDGDNSVLAWGKGEARMVVFGDTEFADNQYLDDFYNRDFFMNSADWLVGEASAISIRPRTLRASHFSLTVNQFAIIFILSVLLLPELLLITGIAVWWSRRT